PKRADVYWLLHVNITDDPYTMEYEVQTVFANKVYFLTFNMGFRIAPRIDYYFRTVLAELEKNKEVELAQRHEMNYQENKIGDVKFVLMNSYLSFDNSLPFFKNMV